MREKFVGILGVPFDYGIELVGGRPGARFAPLKVKKEFFKLIKNKKFLKNIRIIDYGNILPINKTVKKTHERITVAVRKIIADGGIPVVIGGSHDNSFGSTKPIAQVYKRVGGVNIDAHYDVRPVVNGRINSGTPFRRLLDEKIIIGKNFVELGVHSPRNVPEHQQYLIGKQSTLLKLAYINDIGIKKAMIRALKIAAQNTNAIVFDIDIDGIQKRFAPGCSAPCIKGFTKRQALKAAFIAGKDKRVKLFNLMEVSPPYDVNNKTVILAAELIFNFILGLSKRGNNNGL